MYWVVTELTETTPKSTVLGPMTSDRSSSLVSSQAHCDGMADRDWWQEESIGIRGQFQRRRRRRKRRRSRKGNVRRKIKPFTLNHQSRPWLPPQCFSLPPPSHLLRLQVVLRLVRVERHPFQLVRRHAPLLPGPTLVLGAHHPERVDGLGQLGLKGLRRGARGPGGSRS
jgi:hypothetical protein